MKLNPYSFSATCYKAPLDPILPPVRKKTENLVDLCIKTTCTNMLQKHMYYVL